MTQPSTMDTPQTSGLNQRIGGLPAWGWIGLAAAGGIAALLWLQSRKSSAPSDTTASVSPSTVDVGNLQDQLATVTSQIRDLQGQPSQQSPLPAGSYLFSLQGTNQGIYVGIPGVGWAWAPNPQSLGPYIAANHPAQLGTLSADQATSQFGPRQDWFQLPGVVAQ